MQRRDEGGVEAAAIATLVTLEGKRVLDVGCGEGRLTTLAASRAASVYAFDPSAENVAAARAALTSEQRRRVRFAVHGAEALDVARERFDVAFCGWSLWCVPLEGVVHVLCNIHHALAPNGIVVDTQPVSARPRVESEGVELGSLDMCEWLDTIHSVDELIGDTVAGGLYELQREQRVVVTDTFDNGRECLELVSGWRGTHVPSGVSKRLTAATSRVTVQQEVRVRLLGRRD